PRARAVRRRLLRRRGAKDRRLAAARPDRSAGQRRDVYDLEVGLHAAGAVRRYALGRRRAALGVGAWALRPWALGVGPSEGSGFRVRGSGSGLPTSELFRTGLNPEP